MPCPYGIHESCLWCRGRGNVRRVFRGGGRFLLGGGLAVRGVFRREGGLARRSPLFWDESGRGLRCRGELDRYSVAKDRRLRNRLGGKELRHRKSRHTQQMPRRARAVVVADDLDSHISLRWKRNVEPRIPIDRKEKDRKKSKITLGSFSRPSPFQSVLIRVHPWLTWIFSVPLCLCGNYLTNVSCTGPVPLAAWRYAIVSPA